MGGSLRRRSWVGAWILALLGALAVMISPVTPWTVAVEAVGVALAVVGGAVGLHLWALTR